MIDHFVLRKKPHSPPPAHPHPYPYPPPPENKANLSNGGVSRASVFNLLSRLMRRITVAGLMSPPGSPAFNTRAFLQHDGIDHGDGQMKRSSTPRRAENTSSGFMSRGAKTRRPRSRRIESAGIASASASGQTNTARTEPVALWHRAGGIALTEVRFCTPACFLACSSISPIYVARPPDSPSKQGSRQPGLLLIWPLLFLLAID